MNDLHLLTARTPHVFFGKARMLYLVGILTGLLTGCDILFAHALDCLDSDGPEFNKSILAAPVLNQVYQETIVVSINNEPRDDRFNYSFTFRGELPAGLTGMQEGSNGRRYFLDGTPTETGTFKFDLFVSVEEPSEFENNNSGLCYTNRTGNFELTVLPI